SMPCACAQSEASTRTAAAASRGGMPRRLQFTYRWEVRGRSPNSDLQEAPRVAAQDLLAVLWSERHIVHPAHARRVGHERIVDREEDAVGAHLEHAADER